MVADEGQGALALDVVVEVLVVALAEDEPAEAADRAVDAELGAGPRGMSYCRQN